MLVRTSKQTNKEVSTKMGISASYLSRILSGERVPTWSLTQNFARACGADPDVLRTVWESEKLNEKPSARTPLEGPPLPAALRLHQAIRTLHHRAGRPASQDIALASHWTLSVTDVASVIEGQAIPAWQTLKTVVKLLGGDRDYFEALWKEADGERRNGPAGPDGSGPPPRSPLRNRSPGSARCWKPSAARSTRRPRSNHRWHGSWTSDPGNCPPPVRPDSPSWLPDAKPAATGPCASHDRACEGTRMPAHPGWLTNAIGLSAALWLTLALLGPQKPQKPQI
ncbi:helix-turn-helix domain-containing protein [Streptomyces lavendulae]|uniref:helix-turn-helix domain-containing protein n=1 Tax=Streptomyces lavendulae TaxID=1914 RepID=UPI00368E9152